eukprot:PhF_6_TR41581/c0_g1_i3/m.63013/K01808/rpiB; ribose 5-phosphate isomerase B
MSKRERSDDIVVIFASDHGGVSLKKALISHISSSAKLKALNVKAIDRGVDSEETKVDYPDMAKDACSRLLSGQATYAVLIDGGAGIAMGMAANKINGIRAAVCADVFGAKMTRGHNDANVLCLGGGALGGLAAKDILDAFVETAFEGDRHVPRLVKLHQLEGAGVDVTKFVSTGGSGVNRSASPFQLPK